MASGSGARGRWGRGPMPRPACTKRLKLRGAPGRGASSPACWVREGQPIDPRSPPICVPLRHRRPNTSWRSSTASRTPEPVISGLPYLGAEVIYAAGPRWPSRRHVLARRTRAVLQAAEDTMVAAEAMARLLRSRTWMDLGPSVGQRRAIHLGPCEPELGRRRRPTGPSQVTAGPVAPAPVTGVRRMSRAAQGSR